jgi:hypothetical protein
MEFMTHLFRFFIFFHRISRMNREAFLLIGLLTDFRGYLAAGQWLAPYICSCCFCHADFADGADFSSWGIISSHRFHRYTQIFLCGDYFVPQISQIYTDFSLWGLFRPTDFTDIHRFFFVEIISSHRFHRYTQIFLCGTFSNLRGYLHRPDRSPPRKSVCNRLIRKTSE